MKNIEAVVFDMDGLMFDTERLWIDSVKKTNDECGYNVPLEVAMECIGKRADFVDQRFKEVMGEEFDPIEFRRLNRIYMDEDVNKNGLKIKKGLKELISFLKENNIKIAIASSTKLEKIQKRFEQANIDIDLFDSVIGGDMVTMPKPNPQIYLKSCEVLNVNPANAIALEDSDYGIMSAASAGMKAVLVPDIKQNSEEVINLAYKKVDNLLDVINLLEEN